MWSKVGMAQGLENGFMEEMHNMMDDQGTGVVELAIQSRVFTKNTSRFLRNRLVLFSGK